MCIRLSNPTDYDSVYAALSAAYMEAERYYYTAYTKNHERKRPFMDWDKQYFLAHARLWLVMLATWNHMNGCVDSIDENYAEILHRAYNASFEDCLVAMYG